MQLRYIIGNELSKMRQYNGQNDGMSSSLSKLWVSSGLFRRSRRLKGLCHICFSTNETLTLCEGTPKCSKCYEYEECHKEAVKLHEKNK